MQGSGRNWNLLKICAEKLMTCEIASSFELEVMWRERATSSGELRIWRIVAQTVLFRISAQWLVQFGNGNQFQWSRVEKSKLEILLHQYDPTANFASYRSTLKAAIWRFNGAQNGTDVVCILPFFIHFSITCYSGLSRNPTRVLHHAVEVATTWALPQTTTHRLSRRGATFCPSELGCTCPSDQTSDCDQEKKAIKF